MYNQFFAPVGRIDHLLFGLSGWAPSHWTEEFRDGHFCELVSLPSCRLIFPYPKLCYFWIGGDTTATRQNTLLIFASACFGLLRCRIVGLTEADSSRAKQMPDLYNPVKRTIGDLLSRQPDPLAG